MENTQSLNYKYQLYTLIFVNTISLKSIDYFKSCVKDKLYNYTTVHPFRRKFTVYT